MAELPPAPWRLHPSKPGTVLDKKGRIIASGLLPEVACLLAAAPNLFSTLQAFVDYYDQAGMPGRLTAKVEDDPPDGFDGDEVFNVRYGRAALTKAAGQPTPESAS
jgi:hypothetical protein